jgi:hypothetical protein
MTSENRVTIQPADIEVLEFVCKTCGATAGRNFSNERHYIPSRCTNCDTEWLTGGSPLHQAIAGLSRNIRTINEMGEEPKFLIRFHLKRNPDAE